MEVAKRPDKNDATMDVSASQLVGNRPPVPHQPGVSNNDASMWIGNVVSTDDFAPTAVKKPSRKGRGKLVAGLIAATAVAGVGGYAAYTMASGGFSRTSPSASNTPAPPPAGKPQAAAPAATPTDDAAVAEPAVADAGALVVDAVSAADPIAKKTSPTKRTATKKKVTKKKVATTTKKKRRRR